MKGRAPGGGVATGAEGRHPQLRVGLFGGTFDPPHLGHASAVAQVADRLRLDRVLWIPAAAAPHKSGRPAAPGPARRRMVAAATRADPRFRLCDLELERGGVSYTVDTLRAITERHPEWSLWLLLGTDLADGFRSWKEPDVVARLAQVVAVPRPGSPQAPVPRPGSPQASVRPFPTVHVTPVDLSSSRIRDRVERGLPVGNMVSPAVLTIIEDEGLYHRSSAPARRFEPETTVRETECSRAS